MHSTVTLTMADGVKVVVPDSLDLITPYVLREQQDWFEDEIKFLRRLLQPGHKVVDIGANYGLYALSMAQTVGPSGQVWAFEPASATAALLRESIEANRFGYVTLEQCAMSETEGTAQLSMHSQSELNALIHDKESTQPTEAVRLVTLDGYADKCGWEDIDFIKIDAEGEEVNILKGGADYFTRHSPLVQFEITDGKHVHLDLVQAFAELDYESYRLVPGLDLLIPISSDPQADRYLLNLFACKSDRAAELASGGWLADKVPGRNASGELLAGIAHDELDKNKYNWRATLATLPYGIKLAAHWEQAVSGGETESVEEALAFYALSRDASRSATERFCALDCSYYRFKSLVEDSPTHPHLASLARIAQEYGARSVAIDALAQLCKSIEQKKNVDIHEPFLAPAARFDSLDPGGTFGDWMLMAVYEELERLRAYSSFYSGVSGKELLETICNSNFAGPEMRRRLSLLRQRFNLPESAPSR